MVNVVEMGRDELSAMINTKTAKRRKEYLQSIAKEETKQTKQLRAEIVLLKRQAQEYQYEIKRQEELKRYFEMMLNQNRGEYTSIIERLKFENAKLKNTIDEQQVVIRLLAKDGKVVTCAKQT